jgi:hypothetical protein
MTKYRSYKIEKSFTEKLPDGSTVNKYNIRWNNKSVWVFDDIMSRLQHPIRKESGHLKLQEPAEELYNKQAYTTGNVNYQELADGQGFRLRENKLQKLKEFISKHNETNSDKITYEVPQKLSNGVITMEYLQSLLDAQENLLPVTKTKAVEVESIKAPPVPKPKITPTYTTEQKMRFITDLLKTARNQKLSESHLQKLYELAGKEILGTKEKDDETGKELKKILEEIEKLKEELAEVKNKTKSENTKEKENPPIPEPPVKAMSMTDHKPDDVRNFLKNFSATGLKFLIHDFDVSGQIFDREDVLKTCRVYFDKFTKQYNIPASLYARINKFAFAEYKEGSFWSFGTKHNYTWQHPEIIEWCNNNAGIHPINNQKFLENMFLPFSKSIRIKENLHDHVHEILIKKLDSEYVEYTIHYSAENLNQANEYLDVERLIKGISNIVSTIKERKHRSREFSIDYVAIGRRRYLVIGHINSHSTVPLSSEMLKGDLSQAKENFFQTCHWHIIDYIEGEKKILPVWYNSSEINDDYILNFEPKGFTHILTIN